MSIPDVSPKKSRDLWRILLRICYGLAACFIALIAFCALCLAVKARSDAKVVAQRQEELYYDLATRHNALLETVKKQGKMLNEITSAADAPATPGLRTANVARGSSASRR